MIRKRNSGSYVVPRFGSHDSRITWSHRWPNELVPSHQLRGRIEASGGQAEQELQRHPRPVGEVSTASRRENMENPARVG